MGQDQTVDTNLEDHAMFRDDTETNTELMAGDEPEWQEDQEYEVEEAEESFPEEHGYPFADPMGNSSSKLPVILGSILILLGLSHAAILMVAPASIQGLASSLGSLGLSPAHPILAGLVFWVMSRQQAQPHRDPVELENLLREQFDEFVTRIPSSDGSGAGVEDVDRILMALQRQDEKINNLTRATKMYGKPMVEITTQVSETANQLKDLGVAIGELREQMGKISEPLVAGLDQVKSKLDGYKKELSQTLVTSLDESKKHLSATAAKLANSIEKNSTSEWDGMLRSIQQELASIATGVSQIRNQPMAAPQSAVAAAPAPAPAPATAPLPATSQSSDAAPSAKPPGGLAHSIAGTRKAGGKNVLGAIAKLKNMRK